MNKKALAINQTVFDSINTDFPVFKFTKRDVSFNTALSYRNSGNTKALLGKFFTDKQAKKLKKGYFYKLIKGK